jgi:Helix-turn-helix domain
MEYSITDAGKLTGRSADSVRRAIRAGKLKAAKHPTAGYRITDTDLEAWAGPATPNDKVGELSTELDAARALIESQAADLDTLRELLTRERQIADDAREAQRVTTAALGALTMRLEALPPGKTRRPWFRQRSKNSEPPAER